MSEQNEPVVLVDHGDYCTACDERGYTFSAPVNNDGVVTCPDVRGAPHHAPRTPLVYRNGVPTCPACGEIFTESIGAAVTRLTREVRELRVTMAAKPSAPAQEQATATTWDEEAVCDIVASFGCKTDEPWGAGLTRLHLSYCWSAERCRALAETIGVHGWEPPNSGAPVYVKPDPTDPTRDIATLDPHDAQPIGHLVTTELMAGDKPIGRVYRVDGSQAEPTPAPVVVASSAPETTADDVKRNLARVWAWMMRVYQKGDDWLKIDDIAEAVGLTTAQVADALDHGASIHRVARMVRAMPGGAPAVWLFAPIAPNAEDIVGSLDVPSEPDAPPMDPTAVALAMLATMAKPAIVDPIKPPRVISREDEAVLREIVERDKIGIITETEHASMDSGRPIANVRASLDRLKSLGLIKSCREMSIDENAWTATDAGRATMATLDGVP